MSNCRKTFGFTHKSGILMPVSSLPSPYGIGSFGKGAYEFVDFLEATHQQCWQVLPLNPTAYGDSPYQSPASMAGNPYFIDPEILKNKGYLTAAELKTAKNASKRVDYGWLFNTRFDLLRIAYSRFEPSREYKSFCRKQQDWLEVYALFMALKKTHNYCAWSQWEECYRVFENAITHKDEFAEEMNFWKWVQFEFFTQWDALRDYAHEKGIKIIGDIPIYVAYDSADVWSDPDKFMLDEDLVPTLVAGCPPDAYAEDGQLWGNPIYNWEILREQGFAWWIKRVKASLALYDVLRIDHFRGFAGYYVIPYGQDTARGGWWEPAPGKALFDAIKEALPGAKIIAEDLGFITEDVRELLDYTGFPGMKVLQFAFYTDDDDSLPRTYKTDNVVVYSGSHDADCTYSWCKSLKGDDLKRFRKECLTKYATDGRSRTLATITLAMKSGANLAMIPMQDYLELTNEEGRMNVPSVAQGNWTWRIKSNYATEKLIEKILLVTKEGKREFIKK